MRIETAFFLELREYSPVEYNLFKNGDISYPEEDRIVLTVGDSVPARSRGEELGRILEKICNERCGFQTSVEIAYKEERSEKNREEDELRIARQVAEISARAAEASGAETAIEGTASKRGCRKENPERNSWPVPERGKCRNRQGKRKGKPKRYTKPQQSAHEKGWREGGFQTVGEKIGEPGCDLWKGFRRGGDSYRGYYRGNGTGGDPRKDHQDR